MLFRSPNLNLIRVRTSESIETPDAFGVAPGRIGYGFGLFEPMHIDEQIDPTAELRVFYSIGKKSQLHQFAKGISRFENSRISIANPNMVELYHQFKSPTTNTIEVLSLCHYLREMSPQLDEQTRMPYPLVLAEELAEKIEDAQFDIQDLIDED